MDDQEKNDGYVPVEKVSFSFVFFLVSGASLLVTLWALWDDEYARRGYKVYQEEYFKEQFAISEASWKNVNADIEATEKQIKESLAQKENELDNSDAYEALVEEVRLKQVDVDDQKELKKFAGSMVDEAYYWYKKAMHEGANFDVQLATLHSMQAKVESYVPIIDGKVAILQEAENRGAVISAPAPEVFKWNLRHLD